MCSGSGGWSEPKDAAASIRNLPATQLYDMSNDISEQQNLIGKHPEVAERLTKLLEEFVSEGRSTPGAKQSNDVKVDIGKSGGKVKAKKTKQ